MERASAYWRQSGIINFKNIAMERLKLIWENATTSFWFIPSIMLVLAIVLAVLTIYIDAQFSAQINRVIPVVFRGAPDAARGLLSTIATSIITVIAIAFSITIVALQQASTQHSPRILRNFTKDPGYQVVLGTYIATFIYALLILRSVRLAVLDEPEFVPSLSITIALLLALICMGLLVYFISRISSSLQVNEIVNSVHSDLVAEIENLFPKHIGEAIDEPTTAADIVKQLRGSEETIQVKAAKSGFVRLIDEKSLSRIDTSSIKWVSVRPEMGDFVSKGDVIIEISDRIKPEERVLKQLSDAIVLDSYRSVKQDPLFAIRQHVDIALKALSPSISDPTTAEYSLLYLGDALCRLAGREFPKKARTFEDNPTIFVFNAPDWRHFVDSAFSQIRREAAVDVHVTGLLIQTLHKIAGYLPLGNRSQAVLYQLSEIRKSIEQQSFSDNDKKALVMQLNRAEEALFELE